MTSVLFPFRITNGSVAVSDADREVMQSKVMFTLGTQINERVMRPQWGIDIMTTVYAMGGDLDDAIPEAIAMAFRRWLPSVRFIEAEVIKEERNPTYVTVNVRYGHIDSEMDEAIRMDLPMAERI